MPGRGTICQGEGPYARGSGHMPVYRAVVGGPRVITGPPEIISGTPDYSEVFFFYLKGLIQ